jgi:tail tube protein
LPQPTWLVNVGLAKEVGGWGVPVNPVTTFLSSANPTFNEIQDPIWDRGLRGIRSETQALVFGAAHTEFDIPDMPWYADDSGHLLMAMLGVDTIAGAARVGTIGAVAAGATSVTYTPGTGGASVTGDVFKIDAGLPTQEVVIPTSVAANVWTVPATGPGSFRFAHSASAPAASLFSHTLTMLNTASPPSYTLAKFDKLLSTSRQIAGCYFEEVTIKFANPGRLSVGGKGRGKLGTNAAASTAVYSAEPFNVPWQAVFTVAGVANARVVDWEMTIKAPVDLIYGMNGTQSPTAAVSDQLSVTGKFIVVPDDYTEYNYYLNNTQPPVSILLDNNATTTMFQLSKVGITAAPLAHGGNYTMLNGSFEAIANATDAGTGNSPLKAVLRNTKAVAY